MLERSGQIQAMQKLWRKNPATEPKREEGHWDHLLKEMQFMAKSFAWCVGVLAQAGAIVWPGGCGTREGACALPHHAHACLCICSHALVFAWTCR